MVNKIVDTCVHHLGKRCWIQSERQNTKCQNGQHEKFIKLKQRNQDYLLYPYLEYYDLRQRLSTADKLEVVSFIDKYKEEPFCLTMSFHAPHAEDVDPRQYIWPDDVDHLYRDVEIPKAEMSDTEWFGLQPKWVREGLNRIR